MKKVQHVSIKVTNKGYNLLSVREFLSLPSINRMEMTIRNQVEYLDVLGNKIPAVDALKQLNEVKQQYRKAS